MIKLNKMLSFPVGSKAIFTGASEQGLFFRGGQNEYYKSSKLNKVKVSLQILN